jgi:hypothetical protein
VLEKASLGVKTNLVKISGSAIGIGIMDNYGNVLSGNSQQKNLE